MSLRYNMSLRVKVELILFLVIGLVVGLGYGIQRLIMLPGLDPFEEKLAEQDMQRCKDEIGKRVIRLDALCSERALRPDVLRAVPDMDGTRIESSLGTSWLVDEGLSFFFVVNGQGDVVWETMAPQETRAKEFPTAVWPASHPLLVHQVSDPPIRGVFLTSEGPALVSSHPIVAEGAPAEVVGTVVVGRMFDQQLLLEIFRQTSVAFLMWPVTDPAMPEDARKVVDAIQGGDLLQINHISDELFRAYATYPDIHGEPALLLQSDVPRKVLARAYEVTQQGLLAQVGLGLTGLVVLIVLFRLVVINPVSMLTRHTTNIGRTNDLSSRLGMQRNDEFGVLATEFDRMVAKLEDYMEQQKRTEAALRESEERYMLAVRGANDGLWDWDVTSNKIHFSLRWKTMLGYEEGEIGDSPDEWFGRIHPEDKDNVMAVLEAHLKGETAHFECEFRIKHKEASYLWVLCRGLAVRVEHGQGIRMAGSQADVTARKFIEEQLSHQALHDSLTALPNRALFLDRLEQAMKRAEREKGYTFAVLFLDLDRFKLINDGLGHMAGDLLLTAVGERLNASVRSLDMVCGPGGTVARFGGDEFALLLDGIADVADVTAVAQRLHDALGKPFQIGEEEVFTTACIGIALSTTGYDSAEEFLRSADTAMYRAKAEDTAWFAVYDTDMHTRAIERLQLENDLRRAVEREEFVVCYQPIVSLDSGKIDSLEALVRWQHPERGIVPPLEFIPIAEETGMIVKIGSWVLKTASRQTRNWQVKVPQARELSISVNLSLKEFAQVELLESIEGALSETGLDPRHLTLEITESVILENVELVTKILKQLRDSGMRLALDDFGTGYSSLSYLHRLPMQNLKIDRAFVRDMGKSRESLQIVRTIVMLAHALEMSVIAEGIETHDQLSVLRELGCEYGQGFLFSKPIDAATAVKLIASDPTW